MSQSKSIINFLDCLGKTPHLYINKSKRYSTIIGAILSIIMFSLIIAIGLYFVIDYIIGTGMSVIFSKNNTKESLSFSLKNKVSMFKYISSKDNLHVNPRVAIINMVFISYQGTNYTSHEVSLEECNHERHFPDTNIRYLLKEYNLSNFYCMSPETNMTLSFDNIHHFGSFFNIFLSKCINTTTNNQHCLPKEEIESILTNDTYYFSLVLSTSDIDHFNKVQPLYESIYLSNKLLSTTINYDYFLYWKKVEYKSNKGFLFNSWNKYTNYQFDEALTEITINSNSLRYKIPNTFASLKMSLYPYTIDSYQRDYPKIQGCIANVGGLINCIIKIGEVLVYMLTTGLYYIDISNSICEDSKKNNKTMTGGSMSNATNKKHFYELSKVKISKISPCASMKWVVCPRLNKTTKNLTKYRHNLAKIITVENVVSQLLFIDTMKVLKLDMSCLGNSFNDLLPKKSIKQNNYFENHSFFSLKDFSTFNKGNHHKT